MSLQIVPDLSSGSRIYTKYTTIIGLFLDLFLRFFCFFTLIGVDIN